MNTEITLIRHGELDNDEDLVYDHSIHLSKYGQLHLLELGKTLKNYDMKPSIIISSPYIRAIESSEQIQKSFPGLSIQIDERLHDTLASGLVGRPLSYIRAIPNVYTDPLTKNLIQETPDEITNRMLDVIYESTARYTGQSIFIVSHGDPTMFVMWKLLNPASPLPGMDVIKKSANNIPAFLEKGEAWKITLDANSYVLEHKHIKVKESIIIKEKEL